ncbi:hypothetical protein Tco_1515713 [Tanacetum coccineum]
MFIHEQNTTRNKFEYLSLLEKWCKRRYMKMFRAAQKISSRAAETASRVAGGDLVFARDEPTDSDGQPDGWLWRTNANFRDYGIFTMLHMDSFIGKSASTWDCCLFAESQLQSDMQRRLRFKFSIKILLHEINVRAGKMLELAKEFDNVDPCETMSIIIEVVKNKEQRECS